MNSQQLRDYSRQTVRLLGMLDKQCGDVDLTPVQAHTLGEIQLQPITSLLAHKGGIGKKARAWGS